MKKLAFSQKRFKYGTLATVITVVFVAIVVIINLVVSMLLERFPTKLDLTADKIFSLSDQSVDYLKGLEQDIEVTVLSDEASLTTAGTTAKQVVEIINRYAQYSDKIKISFVNPDRNPEVITRFNNLYKGDVSSKFVVLTSGDRIKALSVSELISSETSYSSDYSSTSTITKSTAEQAMTSALMYLTDANPMKATVLTTDSLGDISALTSLLETNGYDIEEVDLLSGTIDAQSDLVILNSPSADLTETQVDKLAAYLDNGGKLGRNLVYLPVFGQKATPNLDALLAEWGIEVGSGYALDSNSNNMAMYGNAYGIYTTIDNGDYVQDIQNPQLPVLALLSRPVNLLFTEASNGRTAQSLLATADTAIVIPEDAQQDLDTDSLPKQSVNIMAVGSKETYVGNESVKSNVMVFGSVYLMLSDLMESAQLNNGDYALSAINTMTGKTSSINIVAKDLTQSTLSITASQASVLQTVVMFLIPLAIIIVGIIVWLRRRNK